MKRIAIMLALLPAGLAAQVPQPLLDREAAFAAAVAAQGVRDGTLGHLAPEAIVFRPLPTRARAWYEAQSAADFTLAWQPRRGELAASGDFGYTLGPWQSSPLAEGGRSPGHGWYVTVWLRDASGDWRVLADHGVPVPDAAPNAEPAAAVPAADEPVAALDTRTLNVRYQALIEAALRLPLAQASGGSQPVQRAWLADDLQVLRAGMQLLSGHEASRQVIGGGLGASPPDATLMAASGDLGMSLGGADGAGAYLRLWRHHDAHGWQLAVDVATPVAAAAPDGSPEPPAPSGDADAEGG